MRKRKKILLLFVIMIVMIITSQVNAAEITTHTDVQTDITLKDSIRRSSYNTLLNQTETLEESYNLKDHLQQINVKDQKKSQACWAFSFSSILETSIAKQYNKVSKEYSPMHIEYVTAQMFNRTLGSGAGSRLSTAYCVSGNGPVEETQMPFDSVYNDETGYKSIENVGSLDKTVAARVKETKEFANIYKKVNNGTIECFGDSTYTKQYTSDEVKVARDLVKQHIKTYGAVSADIFIDTDNYYNVDTAAYNYNNYDNKSTVNHVVSIVGWDDNYSIDNFKEGNKPTTKGAYIVLNSYGSSWGDNGYMYISYEDACVEENLMGIRDIEEYDNGEKDYDKIYQYDELGMNIGIPLDTESVYAANKYTRENTTNQEEYIQEVGLYIANTSGVEVYINPDGDEIEKAKLVAEPQEALETGYHTIKLATPLKLTSDKFVVKVKYTNQEGAYIPMEVNYKDFGLKNISDFFDTATANDGECFISNDNSDWKDVNSVTINSGGTQYSLKNSSTCIKVFTTNQAKTTETVSVTGIQLNNSLYSNDNTIASKIIPYAGNHKFVIISIASLGVVAIILFIKFRSLKDVK